MILRPPLRLQLVHEVTAEPSVFLLLLQLRPQCKSQCIISNELTNLGLVGGLGPAVHVETPAGHLRQLQVFLHLNFRLNFRLPPCSFDARCSCAMSARIVASPDLAPEQPVQSDTAGGVLHALTLLDTSQCTLWIEHNIVVGVVGRVTHNVNIRHMRVHVLHAPL